MKSQKQHRYVSRRGPFAQPPDPAVARALDIAENEGWPAGETRFDMLRRSAIDRVNSLMHA